MILVTGATGHVGAPSVRRSASLGHDVVAIVRGVRAARRRLPSGSALRVLERWRRERSHAPPRRRHVREAGRLHGRIAVP